MATLPHSKLQASLKLTYGPEAGPAKMSATRTRNAKAFAATEADCSSLLPRLLEMFDRHGLSWKMSSGSSALTKDLPLSQLSTNSKRSGIWGFGSRVTLSARVFPTTAKEYSLSALIDRHFPITSILTAANCLGILRRE